MVTKAKDKDEALYKTLKQLLKIGVISNNEKVTIKRKKRKAKGKRKGKVYSRYPISAIPHPSQTQSFGYSSVYGQPIAPPTATSEQALVNLKSTELAYKALEDREAHRSPGTYDKSKNGNIGTDINSMPQYLKDIFTNVGYTIEDVATKGRQEYNQVFDQLNDKVNLLTNNFDDPEDPPEFTPQTKSPFSNFGNSPYGAPDSKGFTMPKQTQRVRKVAPTKLNVPLRINTGFSAPKVSTTSAPYKAKVLDTTRNEIHKSETPIPSSSFSPVNKSSFVDADVDEVLDTADYAVRSHFPETKADFVDVLEDEQALKGPPYPVTIDEPEFKPTIEPKSEPKAEPKSEPKAEPKSEPKAEPEPEPKPKTKPKPPPKPESIGEPEKLPTPTDPTEKKEYIKKLKARYKELDGNMVASTSTSITKWMAGIDYQKQVKKQEKEYTELGGLSDRIYSINETSKLSNIINALKRYKEAGGDDKNILTSISVDTLDKETNKLKRAKK